MTLVSLTTTASPARSNAGRSRTQRSSHSAEAPGRTTSSFAASRGETGRSAIRSSGSSKSNRSVRILAPAGMKVLYKAHIATFGAAINVAAGAVSKVAVIQVKRGIGDVIWHLPFIQAIAAVSPGRQVTFLAPPSSCAEELLAAEPAVAETIYFEHSGSELQRGLNLLRLVALLRWQRFSKVWILTAPYAPRSRRCWLAFRSASVLDSAPK